MKLTPALVISVPREVCIHNLFYTLRVYIQYNKICLTSSNKIHGIAKALNFTNECYCKES